MTIHAELTACTPIALNANNFNPTCILPYGLQLFTGDWKFSGRSETSRRTITASVTPQGYEKVMANWIYRE